MIACWPGHGLRQLSHVHLEGQIPAAAASATGLGASTTTFEMATRRGPETGQGAGGATSEFD